MNDKIIQRKLRERFEAIKWKQAALRLFPVATWLPKYDVRRDLRYDIIAGLTVGLTAVPQSLAYAQIGNLAPQYGLYSCFAGMIVYFFMGTSKDASVGPSALVSMLSGQLTASVMPSNMVQAGDPTCSTILAFMSGILLIVMGIAKLGFIVSLFSVPVVSGFTTASGFAIAASQIATLVGLKSAYQRPPGVFVRQLKFFFENLGNIKMYDAIFGFSAIAFLHVMQFLPLVVQKIISARNPKLAKTRGVAIFMEFIHMASAARNVMLFAIAVPMTYALLEKNIPVTVVGKIPAGFPPLKVPQFVLKNTTGSIVYLPWTDRILYSQKEPVVLKPALDLLEDLAAGIVIITMMASLELFAITKALGRKNGYRVNPSQELLAIGVGNFIQGFISGVPVTAAVTRCALNDLCRVRTQVATLISASVVMIAIGCFTEVTQFIPKSALSAIIICAAIHLIEFRILKILWKTHRQDFVIFIVTFLLCLFYDIAYGILICLLINLLTFLRPAVQMKMFVETKQITSDPDHPVKKMAVVRLPYGMKYPSADKFSDRITTILKTVKEKYILIDCQFVSGLDYTGYQAFCGLLLTALKLNKHVMFANVSEKLATKLAKMGIGDNFRLAGTVEEAINRYIQRENSSTPPSKLTPTGSTDGVLITAFQGDKSDRHLIQQLSVEPSFYSNIPITVGHFDARSIPGSQHNDSVDLTSVIMDQQNEREASEKGKSPVPDDDDAKLTAVVTSPVKPSYKKTSPPMDRVPEQRESPSRAGSSSSSGQRSANESPDQQRQASSVPLQQVPVDREPYKRRLPAPASVPAVSALPYPSQPPSQPHYYDQAQRQVPTPASQRPSAAPSPIQTISGSVQQSRPPSQAGSGKSSPQFSLVKAPLVSRRETDL